MQTKVQRLKTSRNHYDAKDMTQDTEKRGLSLNSSALYTIQVQGVLDPNWADSLGGMQILNYNAEGRSDMPVTTLIGDVIDQAALAGILSTVYMLGMPLLSVTYLGRPNSTSGSAAHLE